MLRKFIIACIVLVAVMVAGVIYEFVAVYDANITKFNHKYREFSPAVDVSHFAIYDMAGNQKQIGDFTGKPQLIMFWASWCGVCASEIDKVAAFTAQAPQKGIGVLLTAVPDDTPQKIIGFMQQHTPHNQLTSYRFADKSIYAYLGIKGLPTYLVVNAQGQAIATMRPNWKMAGVEELVKGE